MSRQAPVAGFPFTFSICETGAREAVVSGSASVVETSAVVAGGGQIMHGIFGDAEPPRFRPFSLLAALGLITLARNPLTTRRRLFWWLA